jgi:putative inorganic carbon (hco3(-)) transporter
MNHSLISNPHSLQKIQRNYRVFLLVYAMAVVFFAIVGQVSLNRSSGPLTMPIFHWVWTGAEWLRFSIGGKINSLLFPVLIFWLMGCIWDKELRPRRTGLGTPVLIFAGIALIAWIFSPYREVSWKTGGRDLLAQVGWFFFISALFRREKYRKALLITLFSALGLVILAGIILYSQGIYFPQTPQRIWASFGHPNGIGAVLVLLIPFVFVLIISPVSRWIRAAAAGITLLLGTGIYLSFSRTAWVSLLVGLGILTLFRKGKIIFLASIILLVILLIWGLNVGPQSYWKERIKSFATWRSDPNVEKRLIYSEAALRMIRERPVIGYGPGYGIFMRLYQDKFKQVDTGEFATAPHNYYLSLTISTGILGLLAFGWLLFRVFKTARKKIRQSDSLFTVCFSQALIAGLAGFLLGSLADDPLLNERISFIFWMLIGLVAASTIETAETVGTAGTAPLPPG